MTQRISLATLLLFCTTAPLWIFLTFIVTQSPGFGALGYLVTPLVLCSATAAISILTGRSWFGVALSSFIAVAVLYGSLLLTAFWAGS